MPRFMSTHTFPAGALSREKVDQMAAIARQDPVVTPYRSFLNLSTGRVVCVMDATNRDALSKWFERMAMPVDDIVPVELEGDHARIIEVTQPQTAPRGQAA